MADAKKRLALAICDFLKTSAADGTLPGDEKESIETAIECISDSFKVNTTDSVSVSLYDAYCAHEKTQSVASSSAAPGAPTKNKEAEGLKSKGNAAMQQSDFQLAVDLYTQALNLDPKNPIYLSNRSAGYHNMKNYEAAKRDSKACTEIDPSYSKGWSRLGLAMYALGEVRESMEAYQKGMDAEGNGGSDAMMKGFQAAKKRFDELEAAGAVQPTSTARDNENADFATTAGGGGGSGNPLADLLGGAGGAGGPGGDFASMMQNPMFQNMAQSMMSNPDMMGQLMSNPKLREMANSFTSGGGMPDMSALMSDPNIADLAKNLMGSGSSPPGGPGGTGGTGGS